jgi:hypothetical protein
MNLMGKMFYTVLNHTLNAAGFCIDNGIKVYPVPKTQTEFYIEVDDNGKITRSPKTYGTKEWSEKVCEIYIHYYKKLSPNVK